MNTNEKTSAQNQGSGNLYPDLPGFKPTTHVIVGGTILATSDICYNCHRPTLKLSVKNTGDRPIQVGSHYHFFEVNRYMSFDRPSSFGYHLNIPATTAVRFEPGESKEVELVCYCGKQRVLGFNNLADGYTGSEDAPTFYPGKTRAIAKAQKLGFGCDCPDCTPKDCCCGNHDDKSSCK